MPSSTLSSPRVLALLSLLASLVSGCAANVSPPKEQAEPSCTTEAVQCPDGSLVGRTGPKCALAPCPGVSAGTPAAPSGSAAPRP